MTSRQRLLAALRRERPDRLPVTTHHLLPGFLERWRPGAGAADFFEEYGLDPVTWIVPHMPSPGSGDYLDPAQGSLGFLESRRVANDSWRVSARAIAGGDRPATRYVFHTPRGELTMVLQSNPDTAWVAEHLVKEKRDIDLIGEFATSPACDVDEVNRAAEAWGERGIVRGHLAAFDVYGQPGCWQDACCLAGTQRMIEETFDDPAWVREFLSILQRRKLSYVRTLAGARYDLLELGGGDASTTVISPRVFREFVAPFDAPLIRSAHEAGQRIVYHTCGGMMPILEDIADMGPDAMETFTPPDMGGDVDLAEARSRIGARVCMIGGFDQFHDLVGCTPDQTRAAVRRCFREAGAGGGYILAASDHFFEADPALLRAYAEEARACRYS